MKILKVLAGCAALTLMTASVAGAQTGIASSAHDFRGEAWVGGSDQICVYCHAPHANQNLPGGLLWNHDTTEVASFTMYTNPATLNSVPGQPDGTSKLCLSCHDGTVALDAYGGAPGSPSNVMNTLYPAAFVGQDLSNDHPISIDYTSTHVDVTSGGLNDPSTKLITGPLAGSGVTVQSALLYNDKVQCSSCHDVHNKPGLQKLLKVDIAGSALCLECHIK